MKIFKTGDVVKHKSGAGPRMAVEGYDQAGRVICKWYDQRKDKWPQETFPEETLEFAKDRPVATVERHRRI